MSIFRREKPKPVISRSAEVGLATSGTNQAVNLDIEFADGVHTLPAWIVGHLGGPADVLSPSSLAAAKTMTRDQFIEQFQNRVVRDRLNRLHVSIFQNSLFPGFRR